MNTHDLIYFVRLVQLKNFSKVAQNMNVSQPTVSMALKRLESHFHTQLIHRNQNHHNLTITPAGQRLYHYARFINSEIQLAENDINEITQNKIKFGLPEIIGEYYFLNFVPALVKSGLMQKVIIKSNGSNKLLEEVKKGQLDLALLASVYPIETDKDLNVIPITSYPFNIVVSPQHYLAKKQEISFTTVIDEPFILLDEQNVHADAFAWWQRHYHRHVNVVYQIPSVHFIKKMIEKQLGVGFLTSLAIQPTDNLVPLKLVAPDQPRFRIFIVYPQGKVLSRELRQIVQLLKSL